MTKQLFLQGALYTLIAALTPVGNTLASDVVMTPRAILCLILAAVIAGATALKAFLSTTFSDSGAAESDTQPDNPRVVLPVSPAPQAQAHLKPQT